MIEFGVLGSLEVRAGDRVLPLGGPQQRRVLAALLVQAGEVVPVERLMAVLWGEELPPTALKSLRTYVSRLRDVLHAGDLLVTRAPGYALRVQPEQVDAGRFERLVREAGRGDPQHPMQRLATLDEALGLWRGPAFAEFADDGFARVEAARLEELRLAACEERFEVRLALGSQPELVGELEAFTERHPFRERPRGQLMIARYRSGRQADALAGYQEFRRLLADELGLEPGPALLALERDILRQSPDLDWSAPAGSGGGPAGVAGVPAEASSFVGREAEREAVAAELAAARLVTLTGTGGIGKTRLAKEAATAVAARYPDGVWWCDLAEVTDPQAVGHAVATGIGAQPGQGPAVEDAVAAHVGAKQVLLVLDNCEHVLQGAVPLVARVVHRCPHATVLATSRIRLGVDGERLQPVPPLPVPQAPDEPAAAVALFLDRARAVRPDLALSDQEMAAVATVCRRLDGLPLAIELAAARMRSLNPTDLLQRLDNRFRLLADARRPGLDRHRTLRAVVDWSYGLLSRSEQHLFDRLSVFAGGFPLVAAEEVAAGPGIAADEVLDLLGRLVDHSMVTTGPPGGPVRYHLLETMRQYGREHLAERRELESLNTAHARHYARLAAECSRALQDRQEAAAVAAIDRDLGNLRAALWCAVQMADPDLALRLVRSLFPYALWRLRDEVFRWAEAALELPGVAGHPLYPEVCGMAGMGSGLRGERDRARVLAERGLAATTDRAPQRVPSLVAMLHLAMWEGRLEECLQLCREAAVLAGPAELLPSGAGVLALTYSGRADEAVVAATELRARADRLGNPSMRAMAAYDLGEALMGRDIPQAMALFDEAVALAGTVDNRMVVGVAAVSAASLQARHGEPAAALRSFRTVIDHLHRASDWTHLWTGLRSLVELLVRIGADEPAALLHTAVTTSPTAPPVYGDDAERLAKADRVLRTRLGTGAAAAAQARAAAMTDEQLLDYVRTTIDSELSSGSGGGGVWRSGS